MSTQSFHPCIQYIEELHRESYFTAASMFIGWKDGEMAHAVGSLDSSPSSPSADTSTVFDVASLTKPVATATAILQLYEAKQLDLTDPASRFLTEFRGNPAADVTITQLLTHSAGFAAWKPLYLQGSSVSDYLQIIFKLPFEYPPGTRVIYSCLGYIVLAEIVRRITASTLQAYCNDYIFKPLKMSNTCFNPSSASKDRIASVEFGNEYERHLVGEVGLNYKGWRDYRIRGEVHDNNGFQAGGETGNSGLFSTARDLGTFGRCMLEGLSYRRSILHPETIALASRNHTPRLDFSRGLGWQLADTSFSAGIEMARSAFGHNGFTGTSLWIDPTRSMVCVLLTNRTYYGGDPTRFSSIRAPFHDLVVKTVDRMRECHVPNPTS